MVDVAPLEMTTAARRVELTTSVQHPMVVDHQHVTRVHLELVVMFVEPRGEPTPRPEPRGEHIRGSQRWEVDTWREPKLAQCPAAIEFDHRCTLDDDVAAHVVAELDIEIAEGREPIGVGPSKRVDARESVGDRRLAARRVVVKRVEELDPWCRAPVRLVGVGCQPHRRVREVGGAGLALHIEQHTEVRRRHATESGGDVVERARRRRSVAHREPPGPVKRIHDTKETRRVVLDDIVPVDRGSLVETYPRLRHWRCVAFGEPRKAREIVDVEAPGLPIGKLESHHAARRVPTHDPKVGVDIAGVEHTLSRDRVEVERFGRTRQQPQGRQLDPRPREMKPDRSGVKVDIRTFDDGHTIILMEPHRPRQTEIQLSTINSGYARSMRPIVVDVDRLQRLAVFDAAARTGSFTAAAAELSTSQPAVTRQIRELEHALGLSLFHRTANRSTLTDVGRQLADAIDIGFSGIEHRLAELRETDPMFVLAAPPGLAQQLIVPVLDELHEAMPDVDIRLWLYDRDDELDAGSYDAAIRVGADAWDGIDDIVLFPEQVTPVAAPKLADELGLHPGSSPSEVLAAPLLHMDAEGRPWMSWASWLATFDLALTPGRRRVVHNSYPMVVQRALAGGGVALGWRHVIDQLLDDGLLVIVGPQVDSDRSYRLSWPRARGSEERLRSAIDWIVETLAHPITDR